MPKPNLPLDFCTACGACVSVCNRDALRLDSDEEGFYIPLCDELKCVGCKRCEAACHVLNADYPRTDSSLVEAFMLKAKDKNIVKTSSSGGVFSLLANDVIKKGGVVYGAAYDYENEVLKSSSTKECSLDALKKSKYVESYMGKTFKKIGLDLKENRFVLFCGTPCQCRGLRSYIKCMKLSSQNLLIVRFICHGVPSNRFLIEYKHWMEEKRKSKIVAIDFRPKTYGWSTQSMKLDFENGNVYTQPHILDPYLTSFYEGVNLRKACYSCSYEKENFADLTIGDFWGIHFYRPEKKEQDGLSVVLLHTEKGKYFLDEIKEYCLIERLTSSAIEYLFRDDYSKKRSKRDSFMKDVLENGYMPTVLNYFAFQMQKNKFRWFLSRLKHFVKSFV